jgi:hypothetical protein
MRAARPVRLPFLAFCAVSIFAGCLGFRFILHYFVLTLPAVGMLIGLAVMESRRLLQSSKSLAVSSLAPVALFCLLCVGVTIAERHFLFDGGPAELMVGIYGRNLFLEAVPVAEYIKENSTPDTRIAVLGSEPEIYFYSHRHSATGHVSTYILLGDFSYSHQMQEQMINEIEAARPKFLVFVNYIRSWSDRIPVADHTVVDVMLRYIKDHYKLTGVAVVDSTLMQPDYYWDADAPAHATDPAGRLFVYQLQNPD